MVLGELQVGEANRRNRVRPTLGKFSHGGLAYGAIFDKKILKKGKNF
jgi:hypothetical protein